MFTTFKKTPQGQIKAVTRLASKRKAESVIEGSDSSKRLVGWFQRADDRVYSVFVQNGTLVVYDPVYQQYVELNQGPKCHFPI